jgi:hypothetical protein
MVGVAFAKDVELLPAFSIDLLGIDTYNSRKSSRTGEQTEMTGFGRALIWRVPCIARIDGNPAMATRAKETRP